MIRNLNSSRQQPASSFLQITAVALHLLGFTQFQLVEVTRHPAVSHVHQQQLRMQQRREFLDLRQKAFVRALVFERDENFFKHDVRFRSGARTFLSATISKPPLLQQAFVAVCSYQVAPAWNVQGGARTFLSAATSKPPL